jgi:hypothetical protein
MTIEALRFSPGRAVDTPERKENSMTNAIKTTKEKAREGGHSGNCILGGGLYCPICRPEAAKTVPQITSK